MKVAVCFFGQPRHLNNPYSYYSQKYWLIDKYNANVYCHSWISKNEIEFDYADQVQESLRSRQDKNSENIILRKYKPKKYLFEEPKNLFLTEELREVLKIKQQEYNSRIIGSFNWTITNEKNHLSQLYSMSKAISLLKDKNYDWIFLTRFDVYVKEIPNLYQLEKDNLYINNQWPATFCDVLIIGGQKQIESLNLFDSVPDLCSKIWYWDPVEFKRVAYQSKFGPLHSDSFLQGSEKRVYIGVGVVRSDTLEKIQM